MIVLRVLYKGYYREINAKVFNTGKLSFPGMISDELLKETIKTMKESLLPIYDDINILDDTIQTVLVNSNFNCGFYLDRDKLAYILKKKYNINIYYDSCSYPGIQCKYQMANNSKMSFMIFRTGSILIVGKCDDHMLEKIYNYIKNILVDEYNEIKCPSTEKKKQPIIKKRKKKVIYISND